MGKVVWSVTDERVTGARWSFVLDVDPDGRGMTVSRDPVWTDLAYARTFSVALTLVDRATGTSVNTGAVWGDLGGSGVRFDWGGYGNEVDLRFYGRDAGVWVRTTGHPTGQPQGVSPTGGGGSTPVLIGTFEVGEDGALRPLTAPQGDWLLEDRPVAQPAEPDLRYTTLEAVKDMLKSPKTRAAASWSSGDHDHQLSQAIRTAETQVDSHCGRRFDVVGSAAVARHLPQPGS